MVEEIRRLLQNREPVEGHDPRYRRLLEDLQCNILSGHRKRRAHYFFVRFCEPLGGDGLLKARYLLGMLARHGLERAAVTQAVHGASALLPEAVQSAALGEARALFATAEQLEPIKEMRIGSELESWQQARGERSAAAFAMNVFLSRRGCRKLRAELDDPAFNEGVAARFRRLNDPDASEDPTVWDAPYDDADALVAVAYDPLPGAAGRGQTRQIVALRRFLNAHVELVAEETGYSLRARAHGAQIEPFGFRDGLSQPRFYAPRHPRADAASEWRDFAPLSTVLAPDPHGRTPHACGTYFVFRKLRQDVEGFYHQIRAIADATRRTWTDILAETVGRKPSGEPLVGTGQGAHNDFDFLDDQLALRCPAHAHIRKVNPRSDVRPIYDARHRRIVRRGLSFGPEIQRDDHGAPLFDENGAIRLAGGGEVHAPIGTLFLCAQANIEEQFEYMQAHWANNPDHPGKHIPGADPIAGRLSGGDCNRLAIRDREGQRRYIDYQAYVEMRGGAYFFAPSLGYLKGLLDELFI